MAATAMDCCLLSSFIRCFLVLVDARRAENAINVGGRRMGCGQHTQMLGLSLQVDALGVEDIENGEFSVRMTLAGGLIRTLRSGQLVSFQGASLIACDRKATVRQTQFAGQRGMDSSQFAACDLGSLLRLLDATLVAVE